MDLFPPKAPRRRARHLEAVEDAAVFADGSASQGGLETAMADVAGAQRASVHIIRDDLSETLDSSRTPLNHEIVIVEIEDDAENIHETTAHPASRQMPHVLLWLAGGGATLFALACGGWYLWQRLRDEE